MNPMDQNAADYDRWFDSPDGQKIFQVELQCLQQLKKVDERRWPEVGVGAGRFSAALGITDGVDPSTITSLGFP